MLREDDFLGEHHSGGPDPHGEHSPDGAVLRDMERIFGDSAPRPIESEADPVKALVGPESRRWLKWSVIAAAIAMTGTIAALALAWTVRPGRTAAVRSPVAVAKAPPASRPVTVGVAATAPVSATPLEPPRIVHANKARETRHARPGPPTPCARLSGRPRARCMYPRVLAADRQLRAAYARAARSGVNRDLLAAERAHWARVRRKSGSEPAYVESTYRALARHLDRARGRR